MNRRAILFLGLAVLLGVAAVLAAQRYLEGQQPIVKEARVETTPVVVARVDLPVGAAVGSPQLNKVQWPKKYAPDGTFADTADVQGRVLRRALAAGEPVLEAPLLPRGAKAGLVAVIDEDQRAVSVKVGPVVGVAGFVKPGARVDVLVTVKEGRASVTKVVLQDIPVLAIDQTMEEAKNGEPKLVNVVTLQVDPEQAEKLVFASHEGRLQLALRNPSDHEKVDTPSARVADLLGRRKVRRTPSGRQVPAYGVQVIKGSAVSMKSF